MGDGRDHRFDRFAVRSRSPVELTGYSADMSTFRKECEVSANPVLDEERSGSRTSNVPRNMTGKVMMTIPSIQHVSDGSDRFLSPTSRAR